MTTSNKELLELAAKAAGYEIHKTALSCDGSLIITTPERGTQHWNPLTDDGDALRLAVKLNLIIEFYQTYVYVYYSMSEKTFEEAHDGDPYKATRRAIVRAAAAIGESM